MTSAPSLNLKLAFTINTVTPQDSNKRLFVYGILEANDFVSTDFLWLTVGTCVKPEIISTCLTIRKTIIFELGDQVDCFSRAVEGDIVDAKVVVRVVGLTVCVAVARRYHSS